MIRRFIRGFADIKKVITNEFYTNPHFNRAFPHIAADISQYKLQENSA